MSIVVYTVPPYVNAFTYDGSGLFLRTEEGEESVKFRHFVNDFDRNEPVLPTNLILIVVKKRKIS